MMLYVDAYWEFLECQLGESRYICRYLSWSKLPLTINPMHAMALSRIWRTSPNWILPVGHGNGDQLWILCLLAERCLTWYQSAIDFPFFANLRGSTKVSSGTNYQACWNDCGLFWHFASTANRSFPQSFLGSHTSEQNALATQLKSRLGRVCVWYWWRISDQTHFIL